MLPASSSNISPPLGDGQNSSAAAARAGKMGVWQIVLAAVLIAYALIVGMALLNNSLRPERAFLLMAAPCIIPFAWCAWGYLQSERENVGERDSGLLLSAIGWLLIFLALLFKHIAVTRAGADAYADEASSPFVPVCAAFGVLSLLAGAVASWIFWAGKEDEDATPNPTGHY